MGFDRLLTRESDLSRGYAMLTAVVLMPVLFGLIGLAFDLGYFQYCKRRSQTAADSGAISGAFELKNGSTDSVVVATAKQDAGRNGFTDGVNGVLVVVKHPPTTGAGFTRVEWVSLELLVDAVARRSDRLAQNRVSLHPDGR